jgi:hypothetical protein
VPKETWAKGHAAGPPRLPTNAMFGGRSLTDNAGGMDSIFNYLFQVKAPGRIANNISR